jgi:hypothetical protein
MFAKKGRHFLSHMLILLAIITIYVTTYVPVAYAGKGNSTHFATSCSRQIAPDAQSLLIILLGQSGHPQLHTSDSSIVSAVELLASLWPGKLEGIPAGNSPSPLPFPINQQDNNLQQQIANSITGNTTTLDPALQTSENLIKEAQFPAGSRILAISNDSTPLQEVDSNLLTQFAQQCIPIDTLFSYSHSYHPNAILSNIAKTTYATYNIASSPSELVAAVLKLYAQWQNMSCIQAKPPQPTSHNDLITVDKFISRISIVAFHPDSTADPTLIGPDSQPVANGVQTLEGFHYTIKSFISTAHLQLGTYIVNTGNTNTTQIWSLIQSPLQLQVIQPELAITAQTKQSVSLRVRLIDNGKFITPNAGSTQIRANVSLLNDQVSQVNNVELQQENLHNHLLSTFLGATIAYKNPGELTIEIQGTYQQASRQAYLTVWLTAPPQSPKILAWSLPTPQLPWVISFVFILFLIIGVVAGSNWLLKKNANSII